MSSAKLACNSTPDNAMTRCIPLPYHSDPCHYFYRLKHLDGFSWLDSGRPMSTQGRYDIFTALPASEASLDAQGQLHFVNEDASSRPFTAFADWLRHYSKYSAHPETNELPFSGGVIGYFSYEWQHPNFNLHRPCTVSVPLVQAHAYNWAIVVDHQKQSCTGVFLEGAPETAIMTIMDSNTAIIPSGFRCGAFEPKTTQKTYQDALDRIHEYILAGDTYQVNFSQCFEAEYSGDLDEAYVRLREATPSPFGAYLKRENTHILSLSPERFIAADGQKVNTQPIKGSAPRGRDLSEDQKLANDLQTSSKNRAENVMIVDLLRNDLSQCCEPHSVQVPALCELHSFANVHHLISTVTGKLRSEFDFFELFEKSFPGGSITGAPKKRAMEIIEELEPHNRNIYCGSIAYFSNNGHADSSITIRTLQAINNKLYCWGGGGIVADSDPAEEYAESIFKVQKIMAALSEDSH